MKVTNIHQRLLLARPDRVGALIGAPGPLGQRT